ncbi:hypothetical protein F511_21051 [Dorcoceras hygrometricum]|uniref:Uncharacterized protein n=1 Tax=Dorcoceras hygrometricum TaxID=472368 RepID=A0A2Z7AX72_9LAMI|nr:hypothetical protein F511_08883 [Dorcoceras hygrometricum]KZV52671.1 hypothetical protein F511_21051 [Dorcoceras hygrometricum]
MPPKRRDQADKNKEVDSMPELKELPVDEEHQEMSVQNLLDRIECHSNGHTTAKQTVEPQEEIPEKNAVDMEEASKIMAEGILAYVKALAWKKGTCLLIEEMKLFFSEEPRSGERKWKCKFEAPNPAAVWCD